MKAVCIKRNLLKFTGTAHLYRVDPPVSWEDNEGKKQKTNFIVVSQTNAFLIGWETYIFPADKNGKVQSWAELEGSRKGDISPDDLLREIGYLVKEIGYMLSVEKKEE